MYANLQTIGESCDARDGYLESRPLNRLIKMAFVFIQWKSEFWCSEETSFHKRQSLMQGRNQKNRREERIPMLGELNAQKNVNSRSDYWFHARWTASLFNHRSNYIIVICLAVCNPNNEIQSNGGKNREKEYESAAVSLFRLIIINKR